MINVRLTQTNFGNKNLDRAEKYTNWLVADKQRWLFFNERRKTCLQHNAKSIIGELVCHQSDRSSVKLSYCFLLHLLLCYFAFALLSLPICCCKFFQFVSGFCFYFWCFCSCCLSLEFGFLYFWLHWNAIGNRMNHLHAMHSNKKKRRRRRRKVDCLLVLLSKLDEQTDYNQRQLK